VTCTADAQHACNIWPIKKKIRLTARERAESALERPLRARVPASLNQVGSQAESQPPREDLPARLRHPIPRTRLLRLSRREAKDTTDD